MRVLLTNDDGIDAPGLRALFELVSDVLGSRAELTVIAPHRCRSECGHSVTTGRPLKVSNHDVGWHSIDGTPVDCVRVALAKLAADVDVVFSGVNAGANLGVDLMVSGTFAAAREASLHGIPAMAVSHYRHPDVPTTWDHVSRWADAITREFIEQAALPRSGHGLLWNVNLPAVDPRAPAPEIIRCPVDKLPLQRQAKQNQHSIEMESDFHGRPRAPGSDVDRCFSGFLTVSEVTPL